MGKKSVQAIEHECDFCGTKKVARHDDPPEGYGGDVLAITDSGGRSARWWACQLDHVQGAIENALAKGD